MSSWSLDSLQGDGMLSYTNVFLGGNIKLIAVRIVPIVCVNSNVNVSNMYLQ